MHLLRRVQDLLKVRGFVITAINYLSLSFIMGEMRNPAISNNIDSTSCLSTRYTALACSKFKG